MPVTRTRRGPIALAVALLAGVAIAAWQVALIPEPTVGVGVGPRAMPAALVALLAALGAAYLWSALRGRQADLLDDPNESAQPGRARASRCCRSGSAILVLTPLAGIGVACSLAFALVARAFGSRRALHDLVVGVLFVFVAWFVFDRLLGVQLGRFASFVPWP